MEYNAIVRSIGESLYATIPIKDARSEDIKEGDSVRIKLDKLNKKEVIDE